MERTTSDETRQAGTWPGGAASVTGGVASRTPAAPPLVRLLTLLRDEAALTDLLVMRLRTVELCIGSGETRYLGPLSDDVDEIGDRLGNLELLRALASAEAADMLGLDGEPTLERILALAPDEVQPSLEDVGRRLRAGVSEVQELRARLQDVAGDLLVAVDDRISRLETPAAMAGSGRYGS